MHPRRKTEMELVHLILPIVGAFLLLFIVCCCGKKVKEVLHIPKEVVMGRYVLSAQLRESNRSQYELAPQSRGSERRSRDAESGTSCVHEEILLPKQHGPPSFEEVGEEFTEITEIKLDGETTPTVPHPRGGGGGRTSERDSGVYSLLNNSVGSVSTVSGRRQHHSSSSAASDSGPHHERLPGERLRHCSSRSEASVIVNVRKASSNNEEEFTLEDGGVCIIHQHVDSFSSRVPSETGETSLNNIAMETDGSQGAGANLQVPTLASLASNCTSNFIKKKRPTHMTSHYASGPSVLLISESIETEDSPGEEDRGACGVSLTASTSFSSDSERGQLLLPGAVSPGDPRRHSCLHTDTDGGHKPRSGSQNRVTFSDSKFHSVESQDSNESVFIS